MGNRRKRKYEVGIDSQRESEVKAKSEKGKIERDEAGKREKGRV